MAELSESAIREALPFWVVSGRKRRSTGKRLHIPSTADREEPLPLCPTAEHYATHWVTKDIAVFPPGYRAICSRCRERYDPDRHPH